MLQWLVLGLVLWMLVGGLTFISTDKTWLIVGGAILFLLLLKSKKK